jgi:hypothetical protein
MRLREDGAHGDFACPQLPDPGKMQKLTVPGAAFVIALNS